MDAARYYRGVGGHYPAERVVVPVSRLLGLEFSAVQERPRGGSRPQRAKKCPAVDTRQTSIVLFFVLRLPALCVFSGIVHGNLQLKEFGPRYGAGIVFGAEGAVPVEFT